MRPNPLTVLAIAALGVFMAFVDATIVNIAFPDIGRSFPSVDISGLSWILNAYNIVFAAFLVAAGRLADLLGRKRVFLYGLVIFTASSVLCAVAPSAGALVGFRILQALGAAALVPSSLGLILEAYPPERRSHAVALLTAVGAAAAGIGPALGGLLIAISSWRLVFLVNLPIGIAAFVLSRRHLGESRAPGRRRIPDLTGAMVFALAIAFLVLGVVKGAEWGWGSTMTLGSFVAAALLGALFTWRCKWHRSPIVDLSMLRVRTFTVANAMSILAAAGFYGYTLCNVLFLTGVWGYSVLSTGLAITPGPFVAAAVAGPASRLAQRVGHRIVLVVGGLIWGGAVFWFVDRVGPTPDFLGEWLPGVIALGLGAGMTLPNLSGAAVASAPGGSFATATSLHSVARQVGAALGVAIVVAIIGTPSPLEALTVFDHAWTFAASCLIAAGLGCLAVGRVFVAEDETEGPSLAAAARLLLSGKSEQAATPPLESSPIRRMVVPAGDQFTSGLPESTAGFLAAVPIFADVDATLLTSLAERSRPLSLCAGEWLFHRGDPGEILFVVRAGRLEVVGGDSEDTIVRELGRGAALGELALLTSSPRSTSVRAARDSDLIAIDRADFEQLLAEAPQLSLALNRALGLQLRESRAAAPRDRPLPGTIAIVPLGEELSVNELAERLVKAIGRWEMVAALDGTEVEADGGNGTVVYGPLLDRVEAQNDRVVLVAGSPFPGDPWTNFCLQQADRIVAVGPAGAEPDAILGRPELRGCDLLACDVQRGSGALAGWVETLEPIETHAVDTGSVLSVDVERLARRLTGRSVGIVLSGGGARAFSHIGVLEELLSSGITIDRVAGVSMGAFVGGLFALDLDPDEIDARCYDEWVRRSPLGDFTLPRHSLIRGNRVEEMLRRTFGEVAIEELDRSFSCASADLRMAELVVARSGSLAESVGLSICIPILGPPQVQGRQILVDGSLIDNLPVGTMSELGEGPIIAVDVKASFDPAGSGVAPDPAADPPTPSLAETLTRVLLLGSANTSDAARRHADLTIKPRIGEIGLLEFHQIDRARQAGRAAAREALEQAPGSCSASSRGSRDSLRR